MSEKNGCIQTHDIPGVDPKHLRYVEIIDMFYTGDTRWFVKDCFNNSTPIFDNPVNIIDINDESCMFLGSYNGNTKLYVAYGDSQDKNHKFYKTVELEKEPKELIDFDSKYALVNIDEGVYFFDKLTLKKSSDIFDEIYLNPVANGLHVFEKTIESKEKGIKNKIIGSLTYDCKIGDFIYDESINGLRSAPRIENKESYDLLDYSVLKRELDELYNNKRFEEYEFIKKMVKINKHN